MRLTQSKGLFLIFIFVLTSLWSQAGAEVLISPEGHQYLSDKMIIGIARDCQKLNMGDLSASGFTTGVESLDLLCAQNGIVSIEPFYKGTLKRALPLKDCVERMYIFTTDGARDVNDVVAAFSVDKHLEYAALYDIPVPYYDPNDPDIGWQYALDNVNAYEAWDFVRGAATEDVIIGISDTGVYYEHPDLEPNMWINEEEDINNNGVFDPVPEAQGGDLNDYDDDGNGYPDDVCGWDFGCYDPDPKEETPEHGTHVAGCASEATDNGIGGAAAGFSAKLIAAKGANQAGNLTGVYQALTYCSEQGAHFVNCSWGSNAYNPAYQNVVRAAFLSGTMVIAAAGNDNSQAMHYPAAYDSCFAVAATTRTNSKASFSNYGDWVDISAPGVDIYSTWATSSYRNMNGTSMSSPVCTGCAALVQAQDLNRTPQQIWDILKTTADSLTLYQANPSYLNLLGAGLVDAYAAVAAGTQPNIVFISSQIEITQGDGDNVLNPGEHCNMVVTLRNIWAAAENVNATLRNNGNSHVIITDSTSSYGNIAGGGEASNNSDPFLIEIAANAPCGVVELELYVTADGGYSTTADLPLDISLFYEGFPITAGGSIESSMNLEDIDGDGRAEIIFGSSDDKIYAYNEDGGSVSGFPLNVSGDVVCGIAVGQVAGDANPELVAVTKTANIYAFSHTGGVLSGFPIQQSGNSYYSTPTLADLDNDGLMEMIFTAFSDGKVYAFNGDATAVPGFPIDSGDRFFGSAAAGDVNGDGYPEIFAGTLDGNIHGWNHDGSIMSGFPVDIGDQVWVSPALGDIDGDSQMEIVAGTQDNKVTALNIDGSTVSGFPVDVGATVKSDIALADVDNDNFPEIFVGTNGRQLFGIDGNGANLSGFPIEVGNSITTSPVIADVDGDGQKEILAAATDAVLYGFNADGSVLANFPIPMYGSLTTSSPAIGYVDDNYNLEIAVGLRQAEDNVVLIDMKPASGLQGFDWLMFGHDPQRTHLWWDAPVGVDEPGQEAVPSAFELSQNYPNPFNPDTRIMYSLDRSANVRLMVYNLLGQEVARLVDGFRNAGSYEVTWDGRNDSGSSVSSGIYFYKLEAGENSAVRKMLLMK
jgi:serine protease